MYDEKCRFMVMYENPFIDDPKYLRAKDFVEYALENILDHYTGYFASIIKNFSSIPMPYVFLSTKAPKKSYGKYTDTEILKQLEKIECSENSIVARLIKSIMETLQNSSEGNDVKITKDVWGDIISIVDEYKSHIIDEGTNDDKEKLTELIGVLKNRNMGSMYTLGEYISKKHHIILYLGSIKKAKYNKEIEYAWIGMVLAHEFFHAMHYAINQESPLWNNRAKGLGLNMQKKEEIKEACADFYSVLWCFETKLENCNCYKEVANERFSSWKKNRYSSWPYAKALLLITGPKNRKIPNLIERYDLNQGVERLESIIEDCKMCDKIFCDDYLC